MPDGCNIFNIITIHVMKKIVLMLLLAIVGLATAEAKGKTDITFSTTTHNFGTIRADKGSVTAKYEFTNTGDTPLTIVNVTNGGCGCTKPDYPRQPIAPGKKGVIKITFNPRGRSGEFNRSVKVKVSSMKGRKTLTFNGVIIP